MADTATYSDQFTATAAGGLSGALSPAGGAPGATPDGGHAWLVTARAGAGAVRGSAVDPGVVTEQHRYRSTRS